jgi:hypothetical protein
VSRAASPRVAEPGDNPEKDEDQQHGDLHDRERRLGLSRRERVQRRNS